MASSHACTIKTSPWVKLSPPRVENVLLLLLSQSFFLITCMFYRFILIILYRLADSNRCAHAKPYTSSCAQLLILFNRCVNGSPFHCFFVWVELLLLWVNSRGHVPLSGIPHFQTRLMFDFQASVSSLLSLSAMPMIQTEINKIPPKYAITWPTIHHVPSHPPSKQTTEPISINANDM